MKPELRWINENIYSQTGEAIFESKAHQYEWMMRFFIVNEPEIMFRFGSMVNFEAGNGPEMLREALRKAENQNGKYEPENKVEMLKAAVNYSRVGIPEHYVSLFSYTDVKSGEMIIPRIEEAEKTLKALSKGTAEFDAFYTEMSGLVGAIGDNSPNIPQWAKSDKAQMSAARKLLEMSKLRKTEDEDTLSDFNSLKISELMDKFVASKIQIAGSKELTEAVMELGMALKNLLAIAMKEGR